MPVVYERLPDFYFFCTYIGYLYKECIKGKEKENLAHDVWVKAIKSSDKPMSGTNREQCSEDSNKPHKKYASREKAASLQQQHDHMF